MDPMPSPPEHLLAALEQRDGGDGAGFCGRFAPSPSGTLHLGNLSTALASWLQARRQGGLWRLRIDDLDTPRVRPGSIDSIQRDLRWIGLTWDGPVIRQSQHRGTYYSWLSWLRRCGQLFPCSCSRRDLAGARVYPGSCRGGERGWGWQQGRLPSWRVKWVYTSLCLYSFPTHSQKCLYRIWDRLRIVIRPRSIAFNKPKPLI